MTDLTPPPELVQQWESAFRAIKSSNQSYVEYMLDRAARWGADKELEACCALMDDWGLDAADLRAARRPQPQPSLKTQALETLENMRNGWIADQGEFDLIRRALALVPDDPAVTPAADDRGPGSVAEQDSPVATDEELEGRFGKGAFLSGAQRLRAVYNLGREHGAANSKPTPSPSQIRSSDPAPTADGGVPLWKAMHAAYDHLLNRDQGELESGHFYAAELRVVADWLERRWPEGPDMHPCVCADWLRAEADRAEAGG